MICSAQIYLQVWLEASDMDLPLTGQPSQVLPMLVQVISSRVDKAEIKKFYIRRSVDPDSIANAHGCDAYGILYETSSIENAVAVEESLIKLFFRHPKYYDRAMDPGVGISEEDGCLVYVAFWC
jgi:hypothetical protein